MCNQLSFEQIGVNYMYFVAIKNMQNFSTWNHSTIIKKKNIYSTYLVPVSKEIHYKCIQILYDPGLHKFKSSRGYYHARVHNWCKYIYLFTWYLYNVKIEVVSATMGFIWFLNTNPWSCYIYLGFFSVALFI